MSIITTKLFLLPCLEDTRDLEIKLSKNPDLISFVVDGYHLELTFDSNLHSEVYIIKSIYIDIMGEMYNKLSLQITELELELIKAKSK